MKVNPINLPDGSQFHDNKTKSAVLEDRGSLIFYHVGLRLFGLFLSNKK